MPYVDFKDSDAAGLTFSATMGWANRNSCRHSCSRLVTDPVALEVPTLHVDSAGSIVDIRGIDIMLGIACDPLQHTSMYERGSDGTCSLSF